MQVHFREVDPFNFWLWVRFADIPSQGEKSYLNGIFDSWYVLGKLGGFNAESLQTHEKGQDLSCFSYDNDQLSNLMPALMHNLGELEYQGQWARCWVDLGTSDSISIDILINSLSQVDSDLLNIVELYLGGFNEDWPVSDHPEAIFT
tara:strand:+ start:898 stop:1338 length:441 start_codon:yes stop_codon:yes gene_type:complete